MATELDLEGCDRVTLGRRPGTADRLESGFYTAGSHHAHLYPELAPSRPAPAVDGRHTCTTNGGNPNGKPVVLLHGGSGAGCNANMRRFHDPAKYRIVLFDQRGGGRSTPHADLVDNTTWDLVADIEKASASTLGIATLAGVRRQLGSTCAGLCRDPPQRVTELVLRGIFMLRRWELEMVLPEGASRLFPDAGAHYIAAIPEVERGPDLRPSIAA